MNELTATINDAIKGTVSFDVNPARRRLIVAETAATAARKWFAEWLRNQYANLAINDVLCNLADKVGQEDAASE